MHKSRFAVIFESNCRSDPAAAFLVFANAGSLVFSRSLFILSSSLCGIQTSEFPIDPNSGTLLPLGDDDYIYIEECPSPRAVTVIIRGASKYSTDEAERALTDALSVVRNVVEDGKMIYGGGFPEIHMHNAIKKLADKTTGKVFAILRKI